MIFAHVLRGEKCRAARLLPLQPPVSESLTIQVKDRSAPKWVSITMKVVYIAPPWISPAHPNHITLKNHGLSGLVYPQFNYSFPHPFSDHAWGTFFMVL